MGKRVVALLLLVLLCPEAEARPRKRSTGTADKSAAKALARKHFKLGKQLFGRQKYSEAIAEFKIAYRIRRHPVILYNIAVTYAYQGNIVGAAETARYYLNSTKAKEQTLPRIVRSALTQTGVIIVKTSNPAAEILVDGFPKGKGRAEVTVKTGSHAVKIRLGPRVIARETIQVRPREVRVWDLKEIRGADPPPRRVRRAPPPRPDPRPVTKPTAEPKRARGKLHWAYFTAALGLTVGAIAAGVAVDLQARKAYAEYEDGHRTSKNLYDRTIRLRNITIGLYAVAAGAGIAGLVLAFYTRWRKREQSKPGVSVMPTTGPGNIGFGLRWEY